MASDIGNDADAADVSSRTGMGEPEQTTQTGEESATDTGEETETQDSTEESEDEAEETAETGTEADEGEDGEESETGEESEEAEAEDEPDTAGKKRSVPYSRLRTETQRRQAAEAQLSDRKQLTEAITALTQVVATMQGKKDGTAQEPDEVEAAAKELAEELGMESGLGAEQLSKVLRKATALAEKKLGAKVPGDLEGMKKTLEGLQKQSLTVAEQEHFDSEWKGVVPGLKRRFPNATEAMLTEAKEKMDEIAHSKEGGKIVKRGKEEIFVPHDLDFILFRNRKTFDTILKAAKKGQSGETGHTVHREGASDEGAEGDLGMIDPENMNPESFKREERRQRAVSDAHGGPKSGVRVHAPITKGR